MKIFPRWFGPAELGGVLGLCAFVYGIWMIYRPAACIAGGLALFLLSWFAAKLDPRQR